MNGYVCFYRGKRIEVQAVTAYEAQCLAAEILRLKPKQRPDVAVVLAEKDGEPVTHSPASL